MIPRECMRLAEVDFPISEISQHAVKEKSGPKTGHFATLHRWWVRRPLASCRALLMGLLLQIHMTLIAQIRSRKRLE